jgi:5-carboxymethyl-2-hydroxymuconate isomerase
MPHFILEYSRNLEPELDVPELFRKLRTAALETGVFPPGGIRFRAYPCETYLVADGKPENAFVHLTLKLGHGRTLDVRRSAGEKLFSALTEHLNPIYEKRPLAISFEMRELDPELSFKKNNLHKSGVQLETSAPRASGASTARMRRAVRGRGGGAPRH